MVNNVVGQPITLQKLGLNVAEQIIRVFTCRPTFEHGFLTEYCRFFSGHCLLFLRVDRCL